MFLVKTGVKGITAHKQLLYRDIGDNLTREQKLDIIAGGRFEEVEWQAINPNEQGDWIDQRRAEQSAFQALVDVSGSPPGVISRYSLGVSTNRDAWVYNSSKDVVAATASKLIANYQATLAAFTVQTEPVDEFLRSGSWKEGTWVKWSAGLETRLRKRMPLDFQASSLVEAMYRPYFKQNLYFDKGLIERPSLIPRLFGSGRPQVGFYLPGAGPTKAFGALMVEVAPCLDLLPGGKFFPRYIYEELLDNSQAEFGGLTDESRYRRVDSITDISLERYRAQHGEEITKDDIFYYVYALLHSTRYRSDFAADLKKALPRVPMVSDFMGFTKAGRRLAELHVSYETVEPYALETVVTGNRSEDRLYRVQKMTFGGGSTARENDRSVIVYNSSITLRGIPDGAYRYVLGARSAIEWIMDRYQVRTDKASGIVNDPNEWALEHDQPRYILDLLKRIVTVSIETMKIVDNLPALDIIDGK